MMSSEALTRECASDCRLQYVPVFTEVELAGTSNPCVLVGTRTPKFMRVLRLQTAKTTLSEIVLADCN